MKLTAEQKQLLHGCVDLSLRVNNNTGIKSFVDILINREQVVITVTEFELRDFIEEFKFRNKDLQQAKDYLTELLEE